MNDSLIVITPKQLQTTNLIFLEHEKLLKTDSLYKKQLDDITKVINTYNKMDSIQKHQIESYSDELKKYNKELNTLTKKNSKMSKWNKVKNFIIGGLGIGLITSLILH